MSRYAPPDWTLTSHEQQIYEAGYLRGGEQALRDLPPQPPFTAPARTVGQSADESVRSLAGQVETPGTLDPTDAALHVVLGAVTVFEAAIVDAESVSRALQIHERLNVLIQTLMTVQTAAGARADALIARRP